jgi:hypothetical protein
VLGGADLVVRDVALCAALDVEGGDVVAAEGLGHSELRGDTLDVVAPRIGVDLAVPVVQAP